MTHLGFGRIALTGAALLALLLTSGTFVNAQDTSRRGLPQIAANDATPGAMGAPGSTLGAPGGGMGMPGGGAMGPAGDQAPTAAGQPGAAMNPPGSAAAMAVPPEGPSQAEINEELIYEREPLTRVRIAIINASGQPNGAAKVAVLLNDYKRRPLEDKMGLQIEVVNISTGYERTQAPAVLYYRPGYLKAAMVLARAIPGDTMVSAMRPQALKRAGVDVEVVVGSALP
jgi:hypothetical protein